MRRWPLIVLCIALCAALALAACARARRAPTPRPPQAPEGLPPEAPPGEAPALPSGDPDKEGLAGVPVIPKLLSPAPDLAAREAVFSPPVWFVERRRAAVTVLCGLKGREPGPAVGLGMVDQGAFVCLSGFPSDQAVTLLLLAPSGQVVGEKRGRVAEGQPIAVVGFELQLPPAERAGVWRVVAELPGQTIERELRIQR